MNWIGHYCIGLTAQPGTTCFNCTIRSGYQCFPHDGAAVKRVKDVDDRSVASRKEARPHQQDVKGTSKRKREAEANVASGSGNTGRNKERKEWAVVIPTSRLVSNPPSKVSTPGRDVNEEILSVMRQMFDVMKEMGKDLKELLTRSTQANQDEVEKDELEDDEDDEDDDDDEAPPFKRRKYEV